MKRPIDLQNWSRREHFEFFSALDDPFFGVTVPIDFTDIYLSSKQSGRSFFLCSLHHILACVNGIEAFKLRIEEGQAVAYDSIHASPTIGRDDGTFGFGFFGYDPDLDTFVRRAEQEIERVKNGSGLSITDDTARTDIIRYSALPWFAFTEMKHAASFGRGDSAPRISTGRLTRHGDRYTLPVSITVHHGLMDGRDVARLIARMEGTDRQTDPK